jgi:hypothetical protein
MKTFSKERTKCENAQVFINQISKSKAHSTLRTVLESDAVPQNPHIQEILSENEEGSISEMSIAEIKEEEVIMDLNPKKLGSKKDNLFFDFFSLYTK